MSRVSLRSLPLTPRRCTLPNACVYRQNGICDEPQINKGNSDAACHRANNKDVLAALLPADGVSGARDQTFRPSDADGGRRG